jgi:ribosomal protein S27AE
MLLADFCRKSAVKYTLGRDSNRKVEPIMMKKARKRGIAKCPKCYGVIFVDHLYTWCGHCGESLPQVIQLQLPNLDPLRTRLASNTTREPDPSDSSDTSTMDSIPTRSIMLELHARAEGLRKVAGFIMFGIIGLVFIGIIIFLSAGYAAQQETTPITNDALNQVNEIGNSLRGVRESLKRGLADDKDRSKLQTLAGADFDPNKIRGTLDQIQTFENTVNAKIGDLRKDQVDNKVVVPVLISSATQRIGIIVLLIFLLQILVPTYRYNLKLAAYYEARADALEILSKLPDHKLDNLILILSPDSLDFGKPITSPTDQVLEVVKEAMKSGRSAADIK